MLGGNVDFSLLKNVSVPDYMGLIWGMKLIVIAIGSLYGLFNGFGIATFSEVNYFITNFELSLRVTNLPVGTPHYHLQESSIVLE